MLSWDSTQHGGKPRKMTTYEGTTLQNMLLDDRISGLNFFEIGSKHGIPPEEVRQLINEALAENVTRDPIEMRQLVQLRLERLTNYLWAGVENGSFKHV